MINEIKKYFLFIIFLLISPLSHADYIIDFENPFFHAIKKNGRIYGFFQENVSDSTCSFWFYQNSKNNANSFDVKVYESDGAYSENSVAESDGIVYEKNNAWIFHVDNINPGCAYKERILDLFFEGSENDNKNAKFLIKHSSSYTASDIRILQKKHLIYDKFGKEFILRKEYLTTGDIVVVNNINKKFFSIQYTNPNTGKITTGWIASWGLITPFPIINSDD